MGVYISGMEMPESCNKCLFRDGFRCKAGEMFLSCDFGAINTDCPLVEVSVPHGRLIDVDALFAKLSKEKNDALLGAYDSDYMGGKAVAYAWSMDYTRNAPTIIEAEGKDDSIQSADVAPVVHARWIDKQAGNATCSNCKHRHKGVYDDDNEDRFCRSCGADMREDTNAMRSGKGKRRWHRMMWQ